MAIAFRYGLFAAFSISVNLITQRIFFSIFNSTNIFYALILGTGTGLFTKYLLDKHFIFYYKTKSKIEDLFKFTFYSIMGIITTGIFWGFELGFHYLFQIENAKYIGAIIGLTIGYFIKYHLDKKFVFQKGDGE